MDEFSKFDKRILGSGPGGEQCYHCGHWQGKHHKSCPEVDETFMDEWRRGYMAALDRKDCEGPADGPFAVGWAKRIAEVIKGERQDGI